MFPLKGNAFYLIAEIGQNHNGSVELARAIIDMVCRPVREEYFKLDLKPMDAVKLTKRELDEEMTESMKQMPYNSPHSFGKTYGEHRAYLELSYEEHYELYQYTKQTYGIDFIETICSITAMEKLLKLFKPDYLKVASRDLTNLPLLDALASVHIPMIISTGMATQQELDEALEVITRHHEKIAILHCVSQYPTHPANLNLRTIPYLIKRYPQYVIGFSDHTIGISAPIAAAAMGARIIEKHVTLDRYMKGSDHLASLGPDGVRRMVRDIRLLEMELGEETIMVPPEVEPFRRKLERSIAAKVPIQPGEIITEDKIHLLSPGDGLRWRDRHKILGKRAKVAIPKNELIYPEYVEG